MSAILATWLTTTKICFSFVVINKWCNKAGLCFFMSRLQWSQFNRAGVLTKENHQNEIQTSQRKYLRIAWKSIYSDVYNRKELISNMICWFGCQRVQKNVRNAIESLRISETIKESQKISEDHRESPGNLREPQQRVLKIPKIWEYQRTPENLKESKSISKNSIVSRITTLLSSLHVIWLRNEVFVLWPLWNGFSNHNIKLF